MAKDHISLGLLNNILKSLRKKVKIETVVMETKMSKPTINRHIALMRSHLGMKIICPKEDGFKYSIEEWGALNQKFFKD